MGIQRRCARAAGSSRVIAREEVMYYAIVCTYGNAYPCSRFASGIKSYADAERLLELALSLGYRDAEIVDAPTLRKMLAAKQGNRPAATGSR